MYPYKEYNAEVGEITYNYDNSIENDIYIITDKMVHNCLLNTDKRLIDLIYNAYNNNSCECTETINNIIQYCMWYGEYSHIKIICEYFDTVRKTFAMY